MNPSPRDRITVDLQGLKADLAARAQTLGVTPSRLTRDLVSSGLAQMPSPGRGRAVSELAPDRTARTRIWLRMSRQHADALYQAAQQAGLSPGEFVAGVVAGVPALQQASSRPHLLRELSASCAELATLSRSIRRLTSLLRDGEFRPAQEYRAMLETLDADVRRHLALASSTLTRLVPPRCRARGECGASSS